MTNKFSKLMDDDIQLALELSETEYNNEINKREIEEKQLVDWESRLSKKEYELQELEKNLIKQKEELHNKEYILNRMDLNIKKQFEELFKKEDQFNQIYEYAKKWKQWEHIIDRLQDDDKPKSIHNDLPKSGVLLVENDDPKDYSIDDLIDF